MILHFFCFKKMQHEANVDFSTTESGAMEIYECGSMPTILYILKLAMVCKCKVGYFHFFFFLAQSESHFF